MNITKSSLSIRKVYWHLTSKCSFKIDSHKNKRQSSFGKDMTIKLTEMNDKNLKGQNCPQMSLSQIPSQSWNPYYVVDRWQPSFPLNTSNFNEFMILQSSCFCCQMALLLRELILMLNTMWLLGTSTSWVRFCPLKLYKRFSICHCGKWQIMSNLEDSRYSLAVRGEVEILLSDLGKVKAKPMPDKGMIWLSRFQLRKDRWLKNKIKQIKN